MFIEKLEKKDIIEFYENYLASFFKNENLWSYEKFKKNYGSEFITNLKLENEQITFKVSNLKFKANDFDFVDNSNLNEKNDLHNRSWLKFMFEKFGEDYAFAFCEYRKNEKKILLENFEKEFNKNTKEYIDCFGKNFKKVINDDEFIK